MPLSYLDLRLIALHHGSSSLWYLGWPDRAVARAREAVELARRLRDPFNLTYALWTEVETHWLRRDARAERERASEGMAVSEANSLPLFLGAHRLMLATAHVAAGETEAFADVFAALAILADTRSQKEAPGIFVLLAQRYVAIGQLDEAGGAVETGLAVAVQTEQPYFDAELHRLQGEIVARRAEGRQSAEECFHRALDIARAQEAKSLELRAATSLARRWRDQGKHAEARKLLAPVYDWFTEGFDTGDLLDAKALLDELR